MKLWVATIIGMITLCLIPSSLSQADDNEYKKWYQKEATVNTDKNLTTVTTEQTYFFYTDPQDLTNSAAETTSVSETGSILGTLEFSSVQGASLQPIGMEEVDKNLEELGFNISNFCTYEGNNSAICSVDCNNGPYLECFNGGFCVFDNHLFPVCSCPRSDSVVYTGPHCEYRVTIQSRASCGCGCDLRLFFILMALACSIVVMLIMLNVFTVMRYKRNKNAASKVQHRHKRPSVRMTDSQIDSVVINTGFEHPDEDKTPTFSSVKTGSNRLYFENTSSSSNIYLDDEPTSGPYSNPDD